MNVVAVPRNSIGPEKGATSGRVSDHVSHAWERSGYMDLRGLECEFEGGTVTIKGRVSSYFLKQMAQVIAARVEGVTRINNQLHVA